MKQHQGKMRGGARYTHSHGFRRLLGFKKFRNRSEAMREERRIKDNLNHAQKLDLLEKKGWIKK